MRRWLKRMLVGLVFALALAVTLLWLCARMQGADPEALARYGDAKIRVDDHGIPTIEAESWLAAVEAEGYVVASERLFQMDLMRRAASGRLAEWFGAPARTHDEDRVFQDWDGVASRGLEALPAEERAVVDAYARGVNRFIASHRYRWGLEYLMLRVEPEPWSGKDSLLVLLGMIEQLTATSDRDAVIARWCERLGPEWSSFLFPVDHPWNAPMFGAKPHAGPRLPLELALEQRPIDSADAPKLTSIGPRFDPDLMAGSNNWGWCGKSSCFLANDPHLGASVPQTWYALRIAISNDDWVAGVSLPGIPGVVLGMNAALAWAFTNVGEDVDDLVEETLSPDGARYLATEADGRPVWAPIEVRKHVLRVRGAADVEVESRHTHRGPLVRAPVLGDGVYSRQWLAFVPGMLRLPILRIDQAKTLEALDAALDDFRVPAQNVIAMGRDGTLAYRASGTGILRREHGRKIARGEKGEWLGFSPSSTRPRMSFVVLGRAAPPSAAVPSGARTVTASVSRFLATANERIWVDDHAHGFGDDLRKERIRRVLASRDDFSREDMERLQEDTESRYLRRIVGWVAAHAASEDPAPQALLDRWIRWSGVAADDPETFADASFVESELVRVCVERLRRARAVDVAGRELPYETSMKSAWVIAMLEAPDGPRVFGLETRDLANHLVKAARARRDAGPQPYSFENRWMAQHPFVGRVPWLGALFRVEEIPQIGAARVVRVERPKFGASVRMVFDVFHPEASTWIFPVGQSGHVGSPHYRDMQALWSRGQRLKILEASMSPAPR